MKNQERYLKRPLQKGDELVECTIGKELGVSRTPVREAIRQLELEGLVQLIPNKGAFVTGISVKDVMDMYQIRARLEGLCAAMAAEKLPENRKKVWRKQSSFRTTMQTGETMTRSVSRTGDFTSFYMRHQEAGSSHIHFQIFMNIFSGYEWHLSDTGCGCALQTVNTEKSWMP